jgi:hypothetical protein
MNDQPRRQLCLDEPRCYYCDQLSGAVAPCIECREVGIHHYVNMFDELRAGGCPDKHL